MGVSAFLFTSLMLKRERSGINMRIRHIMTRKIGMTSIASAISRQFSAKRREANNWFNSQCAALQNNAQNMAMIQGGQTAGNPYGCSIFQNSPEYTQLNNQYQAMLAQLEEEQKCEAERQEAEELELQQEQDLLQTRLAMINEDIKAIDEALKQEIKDGAPKFVA